jgi:hypothetical protein
MAILDVKILHSLAFSHSPFYNKMQLSHFFKSPQQSYWMFKIHFLLHLSLFQIFSQNGQVLAAIFDV